jgi:hypothetical protein
VSPLAAVVVGLVLVEVAVVLVVVATAVVVVGIVVVVEVALAHVCGQTIAIGGSMHAVQTAMLHPIPYCAFGLVCLIIT